MGRRPRSRPGGRRTSSAGEVRARSGPAGRLGWTDTRCTGQGRLGTRRRSGYFDTAKLAETRNARLSADSTAGLGATEAGLAHLQTSALTRDQALFVKVVHLSSVQVEQDQFPKDPRAFLEARWLDGWMVSPRVAMLELE